MKGFVLLIMSALLFSACISDGQSQSQDASGIEVPQSLKDYVETAELVPGDVPAKRGLWRPVGDRLYVVPVSFEEGLDADVLQDEAWKSAIEIDKLKWPYVAARVEGRLPGEAGYPLRRILWLRMDRSAQDEVDGSYEWFKALSYRPKEVAWLGFTGDIVPQGRMERQFTGDGGIAKTLGSLAYELAGLDFLAGNLEGAVTAGAEHFPKRYVFKISEAVLAKLKAVGFDWLSVANNHSWDFYERGFTDTLSALKKYGIDTSGAGTNLREAARWAIYNVGSSTIRVLGVSAYLRENSGFDGRTLTMAKNNRPGVIWTDTDELSRLLGKKEGLDIVVVHGGLEYVDEPREDWVALYRQLVDMGADIVVAAHPHVLQGAEAYGEGYIFYSLGNFLFPDDVDDIHAFRSIVLKLGVYKNRVIAFDCIPFISDGVSLRPAEGKEKEDIIARFKSLSLRIKNR